MKYLLFVMAFFGSLFADATPAAQSPKQGIVQMVVMIAVFVVVFYFLFYRPDKKRRTEMEKQRSSMKKGDKVTAMGIIGTVFKVNENTVVIKLYDDAKMEVLKAAITEVQPCSTTEEEVK